MPCRLISDVHEWINENPTVPMRLQANLPPRERSWIEKRGKKTLLSLTLIYHEKLIEGMQMMWETSVINGKPQPSIRLISLMMC